MRRLLLAVLLAIALVPPALAGHEAVVLMYHRFGEDDVPSTSIRLDQFEAHLEHLAHGGFTVWPLSRVVAALRDGSDIPDRTVAITVDDAYRSVATQGWPRLKARGWPMTLFVATDGVDQGQARIMNWDEIRALRDDGVEIGGHSAAHAHMAFLDPESQEADLKRSAERFSAELGAVPTIFAYPYGEYGVHLIESVRNAGYVSAFGQHSGVTSADRNPFDLPRFAMNEHYGTIDRFRLAVAARALPVTDATPVEIVAQAGTRPTYAFTVADGRTDGIACYHSTSGEKVSLEIEGARVSFTAPGPLPKGRSRFNCTRPGPEGRWFWFGRQFVTPGGRE
ncbi:MAG: polysaccharide deacetylase family protein [Pseudomonadota bacterium]|nr:polysaccharide deacetylase family protein [Pseudomonadota bacterium]